MNRLENQKKCVEEMIKLYCNKKHGNKRGELCKECEELLNYANKRLENCKFGNKKPNCSNCKIHCYKKDMKEKIKKVMKFSGPRMIFVNPKMAINHIIDVIRYKNLSISNIYN